MSDLLFHAVNKNVCETLRRMNFDLAFPDFGCINIQNKEYGTEYQAITLKNLELDYIDMNGVRHERYLYYRNPNTKISTMKRVEIIDVDNGVRVDTILSIFSRKKAVIAYSNAIRMEFYGIENVKIFEWGY